MSNFQTQNAQQQRPEAADLEEVPALPPIAREETLAVRRDALIQTLSSLDFSAIKEIRGKPSVEVASLATLEQRKQIADRANSVVSSLHGKSDALAKELSEKGDKEAAKLVQQISEILAKSEVEVEKVSDVPAVGANDKLKRAEKFYALARQLALEHGYLVDIRLTRGERLVVPVDAVVTVDTAAKPLHACVVGVGGNREIPFTGEMTYGGLAVLNIARLGEYSANSVLANEFAHAHLLVNRSVDANQPIDATKLSSPKLAPQLAPSMEAAFAQLKPTSILQIHELQSDAWSAAVDLKDVDRLVLNGLRIVLGEWPPIQEGYHYSAQCALYSLVSCDLQHGNMLGLGKELRAIARLDTEVKSLRAERRKLGPDAEEAPKAALRREIRNKEDTRELRRDALQKTVRAAPESYKQDVAKVISYYAASFSDQAEKLAR